MARRDDVMSAVDGGRQPKGFKVRAVQRDIGLDSTFKPMMLMPGVPPPLDEAGAEESVRGGRRADEDALTSAFSPMMLAPTRAAANKSNLDAELEVQAAGRARGPARRARTRKR